MTPLINKQDDTQTFPPLKCGGGGGGRGDCAKAERSEEHTSELQSQR